MQNKCKRRAQNYTNVVYSILLELSNKRINNRFASEDNNEHYSYKLVNQVRSPFQFQSQLVDSTKNIRSVTSNVEEEQYLTNRCSLIKEMLNSIPANSARRMSSRRHLLHSVVEGSPSSGRLSCYSHGELVQMLWKADELVSENSAMIVSLFTNSQRIVSVRPKVIKF